MYSASFKHFKHVFLLCNNSVLFYKRVDACTMCSYNCMRFATVRILALQKAMHGRPCVPKSVDYVSEGMLTSTLTVTVTFYFNCFVEKI